MMQRRNGCHNRPPLGASRVVQNGWAHLPGVDLLHPRVEALAVVPHAMTVDCQYTHSEAGRVDQGCAGCRWRAA